VKTIYELFDQAPANKRREVLLTLCDNSLIVWEQFATKLETTQYKETVCGSVQQIDIQLPRDALKAITHGGNTENISKRYLEPIAAMHHADLEFPDQVEFAYYSIFNAFKFCSLRKSIDEKLILNQALSSFPPNELDTAIERVRLRLL
jgi:hypothetical protein